MNMQQLMQQAQKMQRDIAKKKEEIDGTIFESEVSWVKVSFNGKKELVTINIQKEKVIETQDIEMLEDMIKVACNECLKKIDKETEAKLGQYSSAMNGLL